MKKDTKNCTAPLLKCIRISTCPGLLTFQTLKQAHPLVVEADLGLKRTIVMIKAIPESITAVEMNATYIILSRKVYLRIGASTLKGW